jgi:hypothetical protein
MAVTHALRASRAKTLLSREITTSGGGVWHGRPYTGPPIL